MMKKKELKSVMNLGSKYLTIFILIALSLFIQIQDTFAEEGNSSTSVGDIPIPWSNEINFPWEKADGLWVAFQNQEISSYYRFKVIRDNGEEGQQLRIEQIDKDTCQILSTGVGHQNEKVIYGQVSDGKTQRLIRIYTFSELEYKFVPNFGKNISGSAVVLREMDLSDMHTVKAEYNMGKLEWGHAYSGQSHCKSKLESLSKGLDAI